MYNEITSNKRKTWALMTGFSAIIIALLVLFGFLLDINPEASLTIGFAFSVAYCLISYYVGDQATLLSAGAKPIEKREHFELYTLVENLAITAGIPTPAIYIINDPSPNAFATGRDPQHASIAVTTGLLQILTKQELQGVLAHEMSHIKNFDIRVMTIVVILIGLITLLSELIFRVGLRSNRSRSRDNNQLALVFFVIAVLGALLAPIVAQVIKFAVSRSREYLADASGALLTRYPAGLASALEKIRDKGTMMRHANHATAHLYISSPFGATAEEKDGFFTRLFSTHPPINERIKKLRAMGS